MQIFTSSSGKRVVSHLDNFAHNVGQRIVRNHAIVYNDAVCGDIHGVHSPYTFSLNSMRTSTVAFSMDFVLRAIDNHERTIMTKRLDNLIRLEIIISVIVFTETCVHVVEN